MWVKFVHAPRGNAQNAAQRRTPHNPHPRWAAAVQAVRVYLPTATQDALVTRGGGYLEEQMLGFG